MTEESYPEFFELAEGRQSDLNTSDEKDAFDDHEVEPSKHEETKVFITFLNLC